MLNNSTQAHTETIKKKKKDKKSGKNKTFARHLTSRPIHTHTLTHGPLVDKPLVSENPRNDKRITTENANWSVRLKIDICQSFDRFLSNELEMKVTTNKQEKATKNSSIKKNNKKKKLNKTRE
jgi:hypothetical protein